MSSFLLFGKGLTLFQMTKFWACPNRKHLQTTKSNVTQNNKVVFHRIENIVGKEENAGYQHFLLFPQCFQKAFPPVCQKLSLYGNGLNKRHCKVLGRGNQEMVKPN